MSLIPVAQGKPTTRSRTVASVIGELRNMGPLPHIMGGGLAFLIYETGLRGVLAYHRTSRRPAFLVFELLIFMLVAICLFLRRIEYDNNLQNAKRLARETVRQQRTEIARIEQVVSDRVGILCKGIERTLSAIMFFSREQLARTVVPQTERDLREVMERIDQIQFLLQEMQQSISTRDLFQSSRTRPLQFGSKTVTAGFSSELASIDSEGLRQADALFSLRRSSRKVVILPITVNYQNNNSEVQFHTYTLNLCEEGACIIFSGQNLENQALIDIQMHKEFQAHARIRWIQPARENSFRLAGVQFVDRRVAVKLA